MLFIKIWVFDDVPIVDDWTIQVSSVENSIASMNKIK